MVVGVVVGAVAVGRGWWLGSWWVLSGGGEGHCSGREGQWGRGRMAGDGCTAAGPDVGCP